MRGCGRSVYTVYEEAAEPELRHPPAQRGRLKMTGKCMFKDVFIGSKKVARPGCKWTCLLWLNRNIQIADFTAAPTVLCPTKQALSVCPSNRTGF